MFELITLNNGNTEIIGNMKHFIEIIDDNLGYDARNYLSNTIEKLEHDADYNQAKINTDLESYEMSLESNTTCFMDILDYVEQMKELVNAKRVNKDKLRKTLKDIENLINNQI